MKYQVKRGYSYIDLKTNHVAGEGSALDPNWEVDKSQLWKLEPAQLVAQEEVNVKTVTKAIGQQEPSKEPEKGQDDDPTDDEVQTY